MASKQESIFGGSAGPLVVAVTAATAAATTTSSTSTTTAAAAPPQSTAEDGTTTEDDDDDDDDDDAASSGPIAAARPATDPLVPATEAGARFAWSGPQGTFYRYVKLPRELQTAVMVEALRKPAMHFARGERRDVGRDWVLRLRPHSRGTDPSGFRLLDTLDAVSPSVARSLETALVDRDLISFPNLEGRIDLATDVLCIELIRKTTPCLWHQTWKRTSRLDRHTMLATFAGVRKAAVQLTSQAVDGECRSPRIPLRCPVNAYVHEDPDHRARPLCSEELQGFLDLFPDLETVYVVCKSRIGTKPVSTPKKAFAYCEYILKLPPHMRRHLDIFHDTVHSYIELPLHRTGRFVDPPRPEAVAVFSQMPAEACIDQTWVKRVTEMLDQVRDHFLMDDPKHTPAKPNCTHYLTSMEMPKFTMSLKRRRAIKFKILVASSIRPSAA